MSVYSMKSIYLTNKKLSLMVAWSSSVFLSRFKAQSSIGHLVCFFGSGNSIVSGVNLLCPCQVPSTYGNPWDQKDNFPDITGYKAFLENCRFVWPHLPTTLA